MLLTVTEEVVRFYENFDITNIITPVDAEKLNQLLLHSGYDNDKRKFVVNGFKEGFALNYQGDQFVKKTAKNLKLRVGSKTELWNKVMKEVQANRYAGPFKEIPYEYYIQSPIGLVPKDKTKTRLIFHLSYPRCDGTSVNANIPRSFCTVQYPDFEEAVKMCVNAELMMQELEGMEVTESEFVQHVATKHVHVRKSDMSMAFRHVPMKPRDFKYLILKADHPFTGKTFYFIDKCLPFRSSISCKIFQEISNSIAHLVTFRTKKPTLNYLDDYFFVHLLKQVCDWQVNQFLQVCEEIKFPVSLEKTHWGTARLTFLGFLIDAVRRIVCIPVDKIARVVEQICFCLKKRKVRVHQIQKLCGFFFLFFLCRCVIPGRAFTRHLYALTAGHKLKLHHHVRITEEFKLDLEMWLKFLQYPNIFCRPFMDFMSVSAQQVLLYSDASRSFTKGMGA